MVHALPRPAVRNAFKSVCLRNVRKSSDRVCANSGDRAAMSVTAIDTREMSREEWLAARRTGLGGSDAAAVLGVDPYRTPLALYREKRGEVAEPDLSENEAVQSGILLEPFIKQRYEARTGRKVHSVHRMLRHPKHPFMLGNLDGRIVGEPGLLECKTAGFWAAKKSEDWGETTDEIPTDLVPPKYFVQCMHYIAVGGFEFADLAAFIAGQQLRIYRIHRDDVLIKALITAEADMWRRIQEGDAPPPTTLDDVKGLYPTSIDRSIEATQEIAQMVGDIQFAQAQVKSITDDTLDELKIKVQTYMGDADVLMYGGEPLVTWRNRASTSLDTKALKKDRPEVYDKYARRGTTRTFKVLEADNK
jgi:putative phage-type endonuclease